MNPEVAHITPTTIEEILSQPAAWHTALAQLDRDSAQGRGTLPDLDGMEVVLTGCGTSYYLPLVAASLYTASTHLLARGVPASDILTYPDAVFPQDKRYLLVAISRSGKTPETIGAAGYVKERRGGETLAISCAAGTELSGLCDRAVILPEAGESTRFMTRSFSTMLLAWQYLVGLKTADAAYLDGLHKLPGCAEKVIRTWETGLKRLAEVGDFNQYVYLGQGPFYGLAAESMLKIKEMARTPAEAYHSMELMHGPRYSVDDRTLVTVLMSDGARASEIELLPKLKKMGATVVVICEFSAPEIAAAADYVVELRSGLPELVRLPLFIVVTQLFAYHRAIATLDKTVGAFRG
jgi:glucosamine--fructose-6-phosphate aminotransferase (isomerizing)